MTANPYRNLPSVNQLLESTPLRALTGDHAHESVATAVRAELDDIRGRLRQGESLDGMIAPDAVAARVAQRLASEYRPKLQTVINATGIVLHTNLGRAPIADPAARAAFVAARGYLNLELDLSTGKRSSRQDAVRDWLVRLTGAESATAVNNCAAATVIALRALAAEKEVIV